MGRSYDQEFVADYFKENGCELLSSYTGIDAVVLFNCSCGNQKQETTFRKFKKGSRCKDCNKKIRALFATGYTYEFVKKTFEENGCFLLTPSSSYKNGNSDLTYTCVCKETTKTTFIRYKQGSGVCQKCARKKTDEARRLSVEEIKKVFAERGCLVKNITRKGHNYLVYYRCHCGYEDARSYYSNFTRGHDCSECRRRGKMGGNSPVWNPNLTEEERESGRMIEGYEQWRNDVFARDKYICQCCGKVGLKLCAHHKNGYTNFPEQRTDVNNGVTLCEGCHKEFHTLFGYKDNTLEQFEEFERIKDSKNVLLGTDYEFESERSVTSIYRGVHRNNAQKSGKVWRSVITHNGVQKLIGTYYTELEAAAAYNLKLIEIYGDKVNPERLNKIDHNNVKFEKTRKSSKYKGVSKVSSGRFKCLLCVGGKILSFGVYDNEEEAAMVYNINALKYLGPEAELNPVNHKEYVPPKPKKFKGIYWDKRSQKFRVMFDYKGQKYNVGYFKDEIEAAKAYDQEMFKVTKDARKLNFPEDFADYFNFYEVEN